MIFQQLYKDFLRFYPRSALKICYFHTICFSMKRDVSNACLLTNTITFVRHLKGFEVYHIKQFKANHLKSYNFLTNLIFMIFRGVILRIKFFYPQNQLQKIFLQNMIPGNLQDSFYHRVENLDVIFFFFLVFQTSKDRFAVDLSFDKRFAKYYYQLKLS